MKGGSDHARVKSREGYKGKRNGQGEGVCQRRAVGEGIRVLGMTSSSHFKMDSGGGTLIRL